MESNQIKSRNTKARLVINSPKPRTKSNTPRTTEQALIQGCNRRAENRLLSSRPPTASRIGALSSPLNFRPTSQFPLFFFFFSFLSFFSSFSFIIAFHHFFSPSSSSPPPPPPVTSSTPTPPLSRSINNPDYGFFLFSELPFCFSSSAFCVSLLTISSLHCHPVHSLPAGVVAWRPLDQYSSNLHLHLYLSSITPPFLYNTLIHTYTYRQQTASCLLLSPRLSRPIWQQQIIPTLLVIPPRWTRKRTKVSRCL